MNDWWQQHFPKGRQTLTITAATGQDVTIAYGEVGTGKPLFLLHGLGSWSYNWRCNIQFLSQYFRVICVDAKGYGFSQTSPLPEIIGHQVIELARIIPALCESPALLAAESLGALTALAVAQSHPQLVERSVLINVPVFPKQLPSIGMQLLSYLPLDLVQWVDQMQLIRPFAPLIKTMTRLVRQEVVVDPNSITDEEIYWLTYPYLQIPGTLTQFAADLQIAAREIDRFNQNQPGLLTSIQQNLPTTSCPTLILWSDSDQWFPVEDGQKLHARLPNSQFQLIPNCGHVASSGNPEAVNAAILRHCFSSAVP